MAMKYRIIDDEYNEIYEPENDRPEAGEEYFPDALYDRSICK